MTKAELKYVLQQMSKEGCIEYAKQMQVSIDSRRSITAIRNRLYDKISPLCEE